MRILMLLLMPFLAQAQLTGGSAMLRVHALQDLHPEGTGAFSPLVMGSEWGRSGRMSLACMEDGWTGITGTGEGTLLAAFSNPLGGFGMLCRLSGTSGFRESIIGIGYARPLSNVLRVGIRIDRYAVSAPPARAVTAWPVDLSVCWKAGPKIMAGISVYDPFRVSVPVKYGMPPPRMVRVLMSFGLGQGLGLVTEWEAMERRGPSLAVVLSYRYGDHIRVRLGWVSSGAQPILLVGWQKKGLLVTVGAGWHPMLGGRQALSCAWVGSGEAGTW